MIPLIQPRRECRTLSQSLSLIVCTLVIFTTLPHCCSAQEPIKIVLAPAVHHSPPPTQQPPFTTIFSSATSQTAAEGGFLSTDPTNSAPTSQQATTSRAGLELTGSTTSIAEASISSTLVPPANDLSTTSQQPVVQNQKAASSLPYRNPSVTNWTVIQQDGVGIFDVLFQLFPSGSAEQYVSHSFTIGNTQILDNVQVKDPIQRRLPQGRQILLPSRLKFDLLLGITDLRMTVTTSAGINYLAILNFDVTGIAVYGQDKSNVLSASWRQGVTLGSYTQWIDAPIAVLPIHVILPSFEQSNVDFRAQVAPISSNNTVNYSSGSTIESLELSQQPKGNRGYALCSIFESAPSTQPDPGAERAFKLQDTNRQPTSVSMPPSCAIGVNKGRTLLALRLEPYLVGTYGFQIKLSTSALTFTALNVRYSDADIPPPVFPGSRLVLDAFGAEVLDFKNVRNLQSPPRKYPLVARNLFLRMTYPDGSITTVPATSVMTSSPGSFVRFTTPTWPRSAENKLPENRLQARSRKVNVPNPSIEILFAEANAESTRKSAVRLSDLHVPYTGSPQVRQKHADNADLQQVVFRGSKLTSEYASPQLADVGPCTDDFQALTYGSKTNLQILSIRLKLASYQSQRFSTYKATQIGRELAKAVHGTRSGKVKIRYLSFNDDTQEATYEVITLPFRGMETIFERNIRSAISSGVLPQKVRMAKQDVELIKVSHENESKVCLAALRGQGNILSGKDSNAALPLGIGLIVLVAFAAVTSFLFTRSHGSSRVQATPSSASELAGIDRLEAEPPADDKLLRNIPGRRRGTALPLKIQLDTESESIASMEDRTMRRPYLSQNVAPVDQSTSHRATTPVDFSRRNDGVWAARSAAGVGGRPLTPIARSDRFNTPVPVRVVPAAYVSGHPNPDELDGTQTMGEQEQNSHHISQDEVRDMPDPLTESSEFNNTTQTGSTSDSFNSGSSSIVNYRLNQIIRGDLD